MPDLDTRHFHPADYAIFILTLVISAAIGIFYAWRDKRRQNTSDFLLGGRKMTILPVTLSLMASFLSAVLVLGVPTEIFYHGTMYWLISFSNLLTFPIAAHAFLPVFHRLELTSAYEYLELRFNKTIRIIGCCVFQLQMILYMAVVLYAPALALNQVMNIDIYVSILVIGLVCTFYTAIGGLKAVMWTDVFQMVIVFVGLLTLVIKATLEVGGFGTLWNKAMEAGKLQANNFNPDPLVRHTFWTLVIGGCMTSLTIYASNQAMIQRYLSMGTVRKAQTALYLQLPASIFFTTILVYMGLVLFAKYGDADPVGCVLERRDQLIPWLVMDVLGPYYGLPGLMVACFFSASLSTVSSGVNALALVMLTDIVKPIYKKMTLQDMNEIKATIYSKFIAIVFGLITIGLAFAAKYMGSFILQIALSIFGMVGGPVLGLFVLAMFFPTANAWGAGCGLLASLGITFWVVIGSIAHRGTAPTPTCHAQDALNSSNLTTTSSSIFTTSSSSIFTTTNATSFIVDNSTDVIDTGERSSLDKLYSLSYMWYSTLAVSVVVVVGLLVSCITGGTRRKPVDRRLLSPVYNKISSLSSTVDHIEDKEDVLTVNQLHDIKPTPRKRNMQKSENGNVSSMQEIIIGGTNGKTTTNHPEQEVKL